MNRITRYQDIREGDYLTTSEGPRMIGTVEQYVAWARISVLKDDIGEYSLTLHDGNMYRFRITREATMWTCPSCGGHRYVAQGFPLGGPMNPFGQDRGQRRVCKNIRCAYSYLLRAGELDPNVATTEEVAQ